MQSNASAWHVTYAVECDDGWSVELARGDESAVATLVLEDRGGRPGQPPDWRVCDVDCDDAEAREWLESAADVIAQLWQCELEAERERHAERARRVLAGIASRREQKRAVAS